MDSGIAAAAIGVADAAGVGARRAGIGAITAVGVADAGNRVRGAVGAPRIGGLVVAVGVIACYIPAQRTSRIDPLEALRVD